MHTDVASDRKTAGGVPAAAALAVPREPCATAAGSIAAGRPVMTLYLGVFLGVFCFFALLLAATERSRGAQSLPVPPPVASVTAGAPPPGADTAIIRTTSDRAAFAALAAFAAAVERPPGRALQLILPQSLLFAGNAPQVRPDAAPLLDGVVTILASRRHAEGATAELVLLRPPVLASAAAADAMLAKRAEALTRALLARGAPNDRLGIGIAAASGDTLTLTLRLAAENHDGD